MPTNLRSLVRAESDLRHLERLERDARDTRDAALADIRARCVCYIGAEVIVTCEGGDDTGTLESIGPWHLNLRHDGCSFGVPLVLTDAIRYADDDREQQSRDEARAAFHARVAAIKAHPVLP